MEHRDLEIEQLLGDIILGGGDILSYLNDNDGMEGRGEGSGDRTMEEEGHDHDGFGERMEDKEGYHDDGSTDRRGVYILIKPVLTN